MLRNTIFGPVTVSRYAGVSAPLFWGANSHFLSALAQIRAADSAADQPLLVVPRSHFARARMVLLVDLMAGRPHLKKACLLRKLSFKGGCGYILTPKMFEIIPYT